MLEITYKEWQSDLERKQYRSSLLSIQLVDSHRRLVICISPNISLLPFLQSLRSPLFTFSFFTLSNTLLRACFISLSKMTSRIYHLLRHNPR